MLCLIDRDDTFIRALTYNNVGRNRELSGVNTLEFETNKEVEFGQRVLFKDKEDIWNEYIIIDYIKDHKEVGVSCEVFCEDSTSELYGYFVEDLKLRDKKASYVLGEVLKGTRFEVGRVDDSSLKSFNLYHTNVKASVWKIMQVYELELQVRIEVDKKEVIHRYIDLRKRVGRSVGKRFTYEKDLTSVKKTTSVKDLVTALYGYGKGEEIVNEDGTPSRKNPKKIGDGDYGRKISFADINGGKAYVENNSARLKYGLGKERKHIFGIAEFSDCEDKKELLELTKQRLEEVSKPKITYELKVEDISRYAGFEGEGVGVGDIVLVIDKEIDTRVETRVIGIKDNPLEETNDSEITLGNYLKDLSDNYVEYEKLKSSMEADRYRFNNDLEKLANGVKTSYIQKILDKFNKELNETGGYVYAEEGDGILILNAPKEGNPTQAINLKGGKIAIANHKNPDGTFAYETFGDGDGFTANLIRAGVLRGGKVFFNLEDGTFLIGESRTNYSMYWDGGTLHLRNVDIDLENNRTIQNIQNNQFITNQSLEARKEEIEKAKQAIEDANKLIENTEKKWNKNLDDTQSVLMKMNDAVYTDLSNYKTDINKELLDIKSSVKITDEKISTSVESLNKIIETKDKDIKTYISKNYSSITQTDEKIRLKVGWLQGELLKHIDNVTSEFSTTVQTKKLIESSVTRINTRLDKAESKISQTADGISSKVSKNEIISEINQTHEQVKIKASKIDLTGQMNLSGSFWSKSPQTLSLKRRTLGTLICDGTIWFQESRKANTNVYIRADEDEQMTLSGREIYLAAENRGVTSEIIMRGEDIMIFCGGRDEYRKAIDGKMSIIANEIGLSADTHVAGKFSVSNSLKVGNITTLENDLYLDGSLHFSGNRTSLRAYTNGTGLFNSSGNGLFVSNSGDVEIHINGVSYEVATK